MHMTAEELLETAFSMRPVLRLYNENPWDLIYFFRRLRVPEDVLQLNGQDILFVNNIMYLGDTFDRRMTWRLHIKRTVAKALRTYSDLFPIQK
jgi:hypothetical protein